MRPLPTEAPRRFNFLTIRGQHALAYERLAKEGRKFGISLLVSTQRPSELSPTVLAQCGTWATFRLTNEIDKRAVTAAAEGTGLDVTNQLPGLSRGEAMSLAPPSNYQSALPEEGLRLIVGRIHSIHNLKLNGPDGC